MARRGGAKTAQAWIAPIGDDPEAVSALSVARARLSAARGLERLRRLRLIELHGVLPASAKLQALLARSTQVYNPHKEALTLRATARDRVPLEAGEVAVLVWERGGAARPAAERWLAHETGHPIQVVEGTAWILGFDDSERAFEHAEDLARLRDRRHGLLCNPHAQDSVVQAKPIPLPWLLDDSRRGT